MGASPETIGKALAKMSESNKELRDAMTSIAERMALSVTPRTMISKPIAEASILPPYGTILRNQLGEQAMFINRGNSSLSALIPTNNMIVLDPHEPYFYGCTDMQLLKNWQIVTEAQK